MIKLSILKTNNKKTKVLEFIRFFIFLFFLILVLGYLLIPKTFSKINISIAGFPFYITEIFILLSIIFIFINFSFENWKIVKIDFFYNFLLFFLVLTLSLAIGIYKYRDITFVFRQSAIIYYSLFYFIVFYIFNNKNFLKIFLYAIIISSNIITLFFLFNILGISHLIFRSFYNYFLGGFYFSVSIGFLVLFGIIDLIDRKWLKILAYIDLSVFFMISILEYVRASWVALFLSLIFLLIFSKSKKKFFINISTIFLISIIFLLLIFFSFPQVFDSVLSELISLKSIIFNKGLEFKESVKNQYFVSKANADWRIIAWNSFIKESLKRPLFGWGFGRKFIPEETIKLGWDTGLSDNWVYAHNYILTFLFTSGFFGLIVFLSLIVSIFIQSLKTLVKLNRISKIKIVENNFIKHIGVKKSNIENIYDLDFITSLIYSFLSCCIYILVLGLFGVVLEVPYQGSFLWILFGFIMIMINLEKKQAYFSKFTDK